MYNTSDGYAMGKDLYVTIEYPAANAKVKFKGFITDYSDTFTANWNKEELLQRNDMIATYKNTTRSLTLGWGVPCDSLEESQHLLEQTAILMRMLYGVYTPMPAGAAASVPDTMILNQPPLLRVRFSNLVQGKPSTGLYVVVSSFTFSPDLEAGFFDPNQQLFPKSWSLSLEGDVLHDEELGWKGSSWRGDPTFPFLPSTPVNPTTDVQVQNLSPVPDASTQSAAQDINKTQSGQAGALANDLANAESALNRVEQQAVAMNQITGGGSITGK